MRSQSVVAAACLTLSIAACQFPYPPSIGADASDSIDALDGSTGDGGVVQYSLTITVDGASTGTGSVTADPGGFTCVSGVCTRMFDAGTTLTISVAGDTALDGVASISGDCQSSPCTIAGLSGDRSIAVRFVRFQCAPGTETCAANAYTQCGADGNYVTHVVPNGGFDGSPVVLTMHEYACPMGCHDTAPRCADIDLQNGLEVAMDSPDVSPTGLDVIIPGASAPAGTALLDTAMFDGALGRVQITDTDGTLINVPAALVMQPGDARPLVVLKVRTFTLRAGSTLRANGARGVAVASHFDIRLEGTMDLSGDPPTGLSFGGAGSLYSVSHPCEGGSLSATTGAAGAGGSACRGGNSSTGVAGGAAHMVAAPFVIGGCSGGKGNGLFQFANGGGGALMLLARTRLVLAATSLIDLSGGRGLGGQNYATGGGSGGNGVVRAPVVLIAPGAVVAGRGGSGGSAGPTTGVPGVEGPTAGDAPALGSTCATCGTGGSGGYEGTCAGGAGTGSGTAIAGGGGSVGSFDIAARSSTTIPTGTMKLRYTASALNPRSP